MSDLLAFMRARADPGEPGGDSLYIRVQKGDLRQLVRMVDDLRARLDLTKAAATAAVSETRSAGARRGMTLLRFSVPSWARMWIVTLLLAVLGCAWIAVAVGLGPPGFWVDISPC